MTEWLSLWFAEDYLLDILADKCQYCIITFSFHLQGISKYAYFRPEDRDGRFLQTLVLHHAMCQWVSSPQQQVHCLHWRAKQWERSALFWVITQHIVVVPYQRFRTTYQSHFQGSRNPRMDYHYTLCNNPEEHRCHLFMVEA
jgi:hypothetical protein